MGTHPAPCLCRFLLPKKLLINSLEVVRNNETVLRPAQHEREMLTDFGRDGLPFYFRGIPAQHEREMLTDFGGPFVRPELVEGWTEGFSTASKPRFPIFDNQSVLFPNYRNTIRVTAPRS